VKEGPDTMTGPSAPARQLTPRSSTATVGDSFDTTATIAA
jgi:hypothetical protein